MTIGELHRRLNGLYSFEQLRRKAKAREIPGAVKRTGKHLRFHDRGGRLSRWIATTVLNRTAQRERIARRNGQHSTPAKIQPLSATENAKEFPANENDLSFESDYVKLSDPVPGYFLKKLVSRSGSQPIAPTWRDLCLGSTVIPTVFLGTDQRNYSVELVKTAHAVISAGLNGHKIFTREVSRKYRL